MYLYCICYIILVILAELTVFGCWQKGVRTPYYPLNVDRTLSLRGILALLIVMHHLSGITSDLNLSSSFRLIFSQLNFFGGGGIHIPFY